VVYGSVYPCRGFGFIVVSSRNHVAKYFLTHKSTSLILQTIRKVLTNHTTYEMLKPVDVRKKLPIVAVGKTDKKALWKEAM